MLAAGLLILKWIGIILLGVLGLVLALILLVLFVPVRYRASGSYYAELKGKASVSWLLHILSISVVYEGSPPHLRSAESEGEPDVAIRIFGIRRKSREKTEDADFDEKKVKRKRKPAEAATAEEPVMTDEAMVAEAPSAFENPMAAEAPSASEESMAAELSSASEESMAAELSSASEESTVSEEPFASDTIPHEQAVPHEEESSRRSKAGKKFSFPFRRICDKLKEVKEQKDNILEFLGKEENKASLKLVWKQFKALLKHLLPTRAKGKIRFGFDDPYTTGQVLMYISPFYGGYAKTLKIIPVFEDAVIEGEI